MSDPLNETEAQRIARETREAYELREREKLEEQWAMPGVEPQRVLRARKMERDE